MCSIPNLGKYQNSINGGKTKFMILLGILIGAAMGVTLACISARFENDNL